MVLVALSALLTSGCFDSDPWRDLGYVWHMDLFTEIHVDQVLKSLGVSFRCEPGLEDDSIQVQARDYTRVMLALLPDQEAGNIDFLPGYARKSQVETIRRPFVEFARDPRIVSDPLLKAVFQDTEVVQRAKSYRYVESLEVRRRVGLGPDNRPRRRVEGSIKLVLELEKEIGGCSLWFGVNSDDLAVESDYDGRWWKGDSLAIRREYGFLE